MVKSSRELRAVPEPAVERWDSLYERARSHDEEEIDRFMRQRFGGEIVAIRCRELFAFDNGVAKHVTAIDHTNRSVAGLYMGIAHEMERHIPVSPDPTVKIDLIDPREIPLAVFSTSHGPLMTEVSDEDYVRIIENDCGSLAGCFGRVGLALDQPVAFGPLITDWADEGEDVAPPTLRVVK